MTDETIYDTPEGVESYSLMAEGYNGRLHIERLRELVPERSQVLEIGIGPGVDLDMLAETFRVVGSDLSQAFLDRYASTHPDAELLRLDAVSLDLDCTFDAIYSNKVLHHLTTEDLRRSLFRQANLIRPGGVLLHGLWAGTATESHEGLHVQNYTPETFADVVPSSLELIEATSYEEMDADDSLRVVLRRPAGKPAASS